MAAVDAASADVENIRSFILEAWQKAGPAALGWTGANAENIREIASKEYLEKLLSNPSLRLFLFKERGKVTGFAVNREIDHTVVELAGIVVLEGETGRGVGTSLLEKARESAVKAGFTRMLVKTEAFNRRAIDFYTDKGFRQTGKHVENVEGVTTELVYLELNL